MQCADGNDRDGTIRGVWDTHRAATCLDHAVSPRPLGPTSGSDRTASGTESPRPYGTSSREELVVTSG